MFWTSDLHVSQEKYGLVEYLLFISSSQSEHTPCIYVCMYGCIYLSAQSAGAVEYIDFVAAKGG